MKDEIKIDGVPEGYELVRIGKPKAGEYYIDIHGKPFLHTDEIDDNNWPILRPKPQQIKCPNPECDGELYEVDAYQPHAYCYKCPVCNMMLPLCDTKEQAEEMARRMRLVVMCEECKGNNGGFCTRLSTVIFKGVDYCSLGERKDDI